MTTRAQQLIKVKCKIIEMNPQTNDEKLKILLLCTGNSCRSQMAEAFLKQLDPEMIVFSAGTTPANAVHPKAIAVMADLGLDISKNKPKSVEQFIDQDFDYVITVCSEAEESCPIFLGRVKKQFHIGFADPAIIQGSDEYVLSQFCLIRDQIKGKMHDFWQNEICKISSHKYNSTK